MRRQWPRYVYVSSIFLGGKYDLTQLQVHRQIIHQNEKLIEIFTTRIFYLKSKVNNTNDIAEHAFGAFFCSS